MRVEGSIVDALIMTKKEQQGVKDPTVTYYRIGIVKDEELGEMRCTKDVFEQVKKMCSYDFGFIFNSEYGSLQIDRVLAEHGILAQQAENNAVAAVVAAIPVEAPAAAPVEAPTEKEAAPVSDQEQKEVTKSSKK